MKRLFLVGLASMAVLAACNKASVQFSYTQNQAAYCAGSAITPNKPTATGSVTRYTVNPALPQGLTLNQTDGTISGTPAAASPAANYAVSALGSDEKILATQSLNIAVGGSIVYATPFVFHQDSMVTTVPSASGALTGCSINPALPTGLSLDKTTCGISGKPTVAGKAMDYKVFATGTCVTDSVIINIAVIPANVRASRVVRPADHPGRKRSRFGGNKRSRF